MWRSRLVLVLTLAVGAGLGACGPESRGKGDKVPIGLDSPLETPGDAVTGSPSAPMSPGVNGPSIPGGTGAGGGTSPEQRGVTIRPTK